MMKIKMKDNYGFKNKIFYSIIIDIIMKLKIFKI